MAVLRIVANIETNEVETIRSFYQRIFDLNIAMDMGWIATLTNGTPSPCQLNIASEGGSGSSVPDLSIEVDNFEEVLVRARNANVDIPYGPVTEPWGVRRFFLRDPSGRLLNILEHNR